MVTVGATGVPMPLRLTLCGLSPTLSVIVIEPFLIPVAVGAKVTLMVQIPLEASELPQVFV